VRQVSSDPWPRALRKRSALPAPGALRHNRLPERCIGETRVELDHRPIDCPDIGADVAGLGSNRATRSEADRACRSCAPGDRSRYASEKVLPLTMIYGLGDEAFDS